MPPGLEVIDVIWRVISLPLAILAFVWLCRLVAELFRDMATEFGERIIKDMSNELRAWKGGREI